MAELCCQNALCHSQEPTNELSRADHDLFEIHVRPALTRHCISCHGPSKSEGGLRLTTAEELIKGGDSGPAIVPGNADSSLMIEALRYESLEMPPDEPLKDSLIAGLAKWIDAGAPWPDNVTLSPMPQISDEDREWWCYQPIGNPEPPSVQDADWCRSDLDRFVLAKLESNDIRPSQPVDVLSLVRRVHFTLTGLPPSRELVRQAQEPDFDYEGLVDRLLESDAYGENQAKHWLDLVRYADTDGYRADHARPEAYRYRDYVIRSFNADKAYDQFIREQLAGDEIDPGNRDAHIATMYLRHWIYEHNQRDVETQWHEILSDITETTSDVFLAQGLKCARCHDHKFDPLLQKDYFRIKSFFAAFQPTENHPIADVQTRRDYQLQYAKWESATEQIRKRLHEIEHPVLLKHATREGFDKFIPKIKSMIRKRPSKRAPYEQQIASLSERQFDLPYDKIKEWLSEEASKERDELKAKLAEFDDLKPEPLPTIKFVGSDVGPVAPATFIPDDESETPIQPGFITLLDPSDAAIQSIDPALRSTGRRSTLANWIANAENPLTTRVIVNRIWQQHFGRGLVDTSSDFGHLGTPPSHPHLLDWLARRFVEDGWSLKKLHRRILLSASYRQSSHRRATGKIAELDPNNELLWRMNPRRLTGEEINDAILSASGELKSQRRAIYKTFKRNSPDPLLAAFDSPDRIRSMGRRHRTTTSSQALLLGNSDWAHDRATAIAKRFAGDDRKLIVQLYESLLGRPPSQDEELMAAAFMKAYENETPIEKVPDVKTLVTMPKKYEDAGDKAVDLKPGGPVSIHLDSSEDLPEGDFTIEAVVMLRSLYKDASVRTIVTHWNGSKSRAGWSLGVTSTKSAFKPRNLILQLVGKTDDDQKKLHYEVIASNLRPELNKPYYVAVSVDLDDVTDDGIVFYMRDLSDKDAKLQSAKAKHTVTKNIRSSGGVRIGERNGSHQWDGLIGNIRIEPAKRDLTRVAQADSPEGLPDYLIDWRFEDSEQLGHDSSGSGHHARADIKKPVVATPADRARVALVHALLNSNELIYVD